MFTAVSFEGSARPRPGFMEGSFGVFRGQIIYETVCIEMGEDAIDLDHTETRAPGRRLRW
jgi:hypothetical protein